MINKATTELIGELVEKIDSSYTITAVTDNGGNNYTVEVDCTLWIRPCKKIIINGFVYRVVSIVANESLTIDAVNHTTAPIPGTFEAPKPVYFYGTVRMVNGQVSAIGNSSEFTPMIYFVETYSENYDRNPESVIDYEADVSILFMDDSNFEDWAKASEHYENAINPMRSLVARFINVVENSGKIGQLSGFRIVNHSNFGIFQTNQGHVRRLLEAELSGCELKISLPVNINLTCGNKFVIC